MAPINTIAFQQLQIIVAHTFSLANTIGNTNFKMYTQFPGNNKKTHTNSQMFYSRHALNMLEAPFVGVSFQKARFQLSQKDRYLCVGFSKVIIKDKTN
jgi:hypothetical protein